MNVDIDRLKEKNACKSGIAWLESLGTVDGSEIIKKGIELERWSDLRWGLSRLMTKEQCVEWAIFCAEQVIDVFEKNFPSDKRPRQAIRDARKYLTCPSEENNKAAAAAADAADAAADAAYACASTAVYAAAAADDATETMIWKGYEILIKESQNA